MTKNTTPFFINIDKIIFNFNNQAIEYFDNEIFKFEFVKPQNGFYHSTILVYYKNSPFGSISHKNVKNAHNSQFRINNRQLYISGFSSVTLELFEYLKITDYSLSTFENSINTNIDLVTKFYSFCSSVAKMEKLSIKKGYNDMIISNCKDRVLNTNKNNDTIILKKKGKALEIRIENKTNEVKVKKLRGEIDKTYIIDSYSTVLDITQDIYRMEQTINFHKLRRETHRHCYAKLGNPFVAIPKKEYDKLSPYLKRQYKLVDSQLPKCFDLHLLEDRDFLLSFFAEFKIFDFTQILGKVKPKLLTLYNLRPMKRITETITYIQYGGDEVLKTVKKKHLDIFEENPIDLYQEPIDVPEKKFIPIDFFT